MAIEIRELVIKTEVQTRQEQLNTEAVDERLASMKRRIMRECMDQIERKLRGVRRRR